MSFSENYSNKQKIDILNECILHASHYPSALIIHLHQIVSKSLQENPARALEAISVNNYRFFNDTIKIDDALEIFNEA